MKKTYMATAIYLGLLLVLTLALSFFLSSNPRTLADSFLFYSSNSTGFIPLINFTHNGYFSWRADPFWSKFFSISSHAGYLYVLLSIFSSGTFLYLRARGSSNISALSLSAFLCLGNLLIFGFDSTVIGIVSYLPWLFLGTQLAFGRGANNILVLLILAFLSIRTAQTAQYLAILPVTMTILLSKKEHGQSLGYKMLVYSILLIPSLYFSLSAVAPEFYDYPQKHAALVPDDGN